MMNFLYFASKAAADATEKTTDAVTASGTETAPATGALDWLSFSQDGFVWQSDWWKVLVLALGVLLIVYLTIRLGLYIARIVGVIVCLLVSLAGALVGGKMLGPLLVEFLPESCQRAAPFLAGLGVFIIVYCIGMMILSLIRRPAKAAKEE